MESKGLVSNTPEWIWRSSNLYSFSHPRFPNAQARSFRPCVVHTAFCNWYENMWFYQSRDLPAWPPHNPQIILTTLIGCQVKEISQPTQDVAWYALANRIG